MIDIFSLCSISFKSAQVLNETVRESIFTDVIALNQIPQELQLNLRNSTSLSRIRAKIASSSQQHYA